MIDLLYRRGLIALSAALATAYMLHYTGEEGFRSILAVVGIMTIGLGLAKLPYLIEKKYIPPVKQTNAFNEVLLSVKTDKWGPNGLESEDRLRVSDYNGDCISLTISFNPRKVDRLEIKPIRRPLSDWQGLVADAERLANEPLK